MTEQPVDNKVLPHVPKPDDPQSNLTWLAIVPCAVFALWALVFHWHQCCFTARSLAVWATFDARAPSDLERYAGLPFNLAHLESMRTAIMDLPPTEKIKYADVELCKLCDGYLNGKRLQLLIQLYDSFGNDSARNFAKWNTVSYGNIAYLAYGCVGLPVYVRTYAAYLSSIRVFNETDANYRAARVWSNRFDIVVDRLALILEYQEYSTVPPATIQQLEQTLEKIRKTLDELATKEQVFLQEGHQLF